MIMKKVNTITKNRNFSVKPDTRSVRRRENFLLSAGIHNCGRGPWGREGERERVVSEFEQECNGLNIKIGHNPKMAGFKTYSRAFCPPLNP